MKSEFYTFCQNLESKLGADSIKMITNDTADFFDQMQQKIYGIECLTLKKTKVRELQKLSTAFADRLCKRPIDRRIISKICKRLQSLKENHPEQFNHAYPMPVSLFNTAKKKRKKRIAEIVECLDTSALDPDLKKILIDYLKFQHEPFRISPHSWRNLDYHDLLTSKLLPILKNNSEESLDWALIRLFHRYNFNIHAINDYYIYKIDACFSTNKPIDEISLKRWSTELQRSPLKKSAYDSSFRSLSHDLNIYLKIKLDELEDKGASILSTYYPRYTYSTATRMLMEKTFMEVGYLVSPKDWKKHCQFLSENTRGMRGDKITPKSYKNGSATVSIKTYEAVQTLLTEMLIINKDNMTFDIKKLNRLPKKPK